MTLNSINLLGQNTDTDDEKLKAWKYINERKEVYFCFETPERAKLSEIIYHISPVRSLNGWTYAYADSAGFARFIDYKIKFRVLSPPDLKQTNKRDTGGDDWNYYPAFDEYVDTLYSFAAQYGDLCKVEKIGDSNLSMGIYALKLSANVAAKEAEPEVLLSSTIHGNEPAGFLFLLRMADYVLKNYGKDDLVTQLLNGTELWLIPLINPDGLYRSDNSTISGATRNNFNGIDLNRNFPDPDEGMHPDGRAWQKETVALMEFFEKHNFTMSATYHTGEEVVNYPWDTWSPNYKSHADDEWFRFISSQYADTAQNYSENGYMEPYWAPSGITNGYNWYAIAGGMQDYLNYYRHCREVTIELNFNQMTSGETAPLLWEYNYRSAINYCLTPLTAMTGTIKNEEGEPLAAKIEVIGYDKDSSHVFADATTGFFCRPLMDGIYSFQMTQQGYDTLIVSNIQIEQGLNFTMSSAIISSIQNESVLEKVKIYPNPSDNELNIKVEFEIPEQITIEIYDLTGRLHYLRKVGETRLKEPVSIKTTSLMEGTYFVKITTTRKQFIFRQIIIH